LDFFRMPLRKGEEGMHEQLHSPAGKFLRHAIFGMSDGLVSTLTMLAGSVGASLDKQIILIVGLITMLAGAISMALGTYISTKSQVEFYRREVKKESEDLKRLPQVEKDHVRDIYKAKGFKGRELDLIVHRLTSNRSVWLDVLVSEELGLSKGKMENAFTASFVMFFAFIFGSFIPLSSFVFVPVTFAMKMAMISSLAMLFLAGAGKTHFTGRNWVKSGGEMVFVAALATLVSFYTGYLISQFVPYLV